MALDKNDLLSLIATNLPDNTVGSITPALIRQVVEQMVTADANLEELTLQTLLGLIDFAQTPTLNGVALITDAPSDDFNYIRRDGAWIRKASLIASSNSTIPINNTATTPSYLIIDTIAGSNGIALQDGPTGTVKNVSGRIIKEMVGSISFYPDVSGGSIRRVVVVSETSDDNITWSGNLNSIRKVEVGASSETFKTIVSLVGDWGVGSYLRFRLYDEADGGLNLIPSSETILGQSFTGPSMLWSLVES